MSEAAFWAVLLLYVGGVIAAGKAVGDAPHGFWPLLAWLAIIIFWPVVIPASGFLSIVCDLFRKDPA